MMGNNIIFTKYRKEEGKTKILLMYLILNNYDIEKIEQVEEIVQEQMFKTEFHKIYGITSEFVDTAKIDKELADIKTPVIYSPQSYEMYSHEKRIYTYRAKEKNKDLYINDMGIISPIMVITKDCIVSSNKAEPLEASINKGFMYFMDYVLKGKCVIENWEMTYENKEFSVFYSSKHKDTIKKERLYHALELAQTSTYRLVLYIISKVAQTVAEYQPDNYETDVWGLIE